MGLVPVLDRLEALTLVARELEVDLGGGNDPRLGNLDDRARRAGLVLDDEPVAWVGSRVVLERAVQARRCRLVAGQDRLDEPPPQIRSGVAEPELRQIGQRTSASMRSLASGAGSRSTWCSCQSVNASSPQSWRERSSLRATWRSSSEVTAPGLK